MGDCVVPFLALVSSYGNHEHVCFGIWSPRGVSGYREKQGGRVLSWQLGCGLISLPGAGEALRGHCQAARAANSRDLCAPGPRPSPSPTCPGSPGESLF